MLQKHNTDAPLTYQAANANMLVTSCLLRCPCIHYSLSFFSSGLVSTNEVDIITILLWMTWMGCPVIYLCLFMYFGRMRPDLLFFNRTCPCQHRRQCCRSSVFHASFTFRDCFLVTWKPASLKKENLARFSFLQERLIF